MKEQAKDVLIRALKTFWQAAFGYLITSFGAELAGVSVFDMEALKNVGIGLIIGAIAAGLSAVWNGMVKPTFDKLTAPKGENK